MEKTIPIYIRLSTTVKKALEKGAEKDGRTMANLAAKIINEWAAKNG